MAKTKSSASSNKISFGKRKGGKAKKSWNKHDRKDRTYQGQGR
jgi:hypothetical protein